MKNSELVKERINNGYSIYSNPKESNVPSMMRDFTKALNDDKLLLDIDYSVYINVYTNKTNIEKLKKNLENYNNHERSLACEHNKQEYVSKINELQDRINELENRCSE